MSKPSNDELEWRDEIMMREADRAMERFFSGIMRKLKEPSIGGPGA